MTVSELFVVMLIALWLAGPLEWWQAVIYFLAFELTNFGLDKLRARLELRQIRKAAKR